VVAVYADAFAARESDGFEGELDPVLLEEIGRAHV